MKRLLASLPFVLHSVVVYGQLSINGDFETVVPIEGQFVPLRAQPVPGLGIWYGDPGVILDAESGITPADGTHMLQFLQDNNGSESNIHQFLRTPRQSRVSKNRWLTLVGQERPHCGQA